MFPVLGDGEVAREGAAGRVELDECEEAGGGVDGEDLERVGEDLLGETGDRDVDEGGVAGGG